MGKLLEEMIPQRLQSHMVGENSLSENQFSFRTGKFTVDAIQAVVYIATNSVRRLALIYVKRSIPQDGRNISR